MDIYLRKTLWILLLMMAGSLCAVNIDSRLTCAHAGENQTSKIDFRPIGLDGLRARLKTSGRVQGAEIHADDLITVIRENGFDIDLNNCIIRGTLDFSQLPTVPLERLNFPQNWNDQEKTAWVKRHRSKSVNGLHVVANRIKIENTEFITHQPSINANAVFFERPITFSKTICQGKTDFTNVTFGGAASFEKSSFKSVNFSNSFLTEQAFFAETIFQGDADFRLASFGKEVSFFGATFGGGAKFEGANFSDDTAFNRVTFGNVAEFSKINFKKKTSFAYTDFTHQADFSGTHFVSESNFFSVKFHKDSVFVGTNFSGKVNFENSIFSGEAYFHSTRFLGKQEVFFNNAQIGGMAYFTSAYFNGAANFVSIIFNNDALFVETTFEQKVSFWKAVFKKKATFYATTFNDRAYFNDASISGEASFTGAEFLGETFIAGALFEQKAYFTLATFTKNVHAVESKFKMLVSFKGAEFRDELDLDRTLFYSYADFRGARINTLNFKNTANPSIINAHINFRSAKIAKAQFQEILFLNEVNLSNAEFGKPLHFDSSDNSNPINAAQESAIKSSSDQKDGETIFNSVTFNSNASMVGTEFYGTTELKDVKFVKEAIFTNARFQNLPEYKQPALKLSNVSFGSLVINWEQLSNLEIRRCDNESIAANAAIGTNGSKTAEVSEPLSQFYKNLEVQFRNRKQLQDASNAHYQRKTEELKEARVQGKAVRRIWLEIEWIFWGICCGYGTKLSSTLLTFFITILFFAFIYHAKGEFKERPASGNKEESSFILKGLASPKSYLTESPSKKRTGKDLEGKTKFGYAALLSVAVLFKLQYKRKTISGKLGKIDLKNIVFLEWALGYLLYVALIFTLKNTSPLFSAIIAML
jgi:hypothetical protein